jgi:phosphate transport system permease protein
MREILKPFIEVLGGLPSVVLGFLGIVLLAPFLYRFLDLATGLTALTGSILLGGIAVPTIVSVAEDALDAVPRSYRDASIALGATRWQTIWRVTLPAGAFRCAYSGHVRGRSSDWQTMTVMMVTGNASVIPPAWQCLYLQSAP